MCFTIDQIDRACGLLLLTEFNTFVYCCKQCQCEFESGSNLEVHILSQHQDDKEAAIANENSLTDIFSAGLTTIEHEPIKVKTEQFYYDAEVIDELNVDESCVDFAKPLPVLSVNESFDISDSGGTSVDSDVAENEGKVSIHLEQPQERVTLEEAKVSVEKVGHNSIETALGVSTAKKQSRGRPPGTKNGTKSKQTLINEAFRRMPKRTGVGRPKMNYFECFHCDMCPELSFKSKQGLLNHMTVHHMKKEIPGRMKKCEICNKYPRYSYEYHMKISHSKLEYKCEICNAVLKHKFSYLIHMRYHSGEKPYQCNQCDSTFISKPKCNAHERSVHGAITERKDAQSTPLRDYINAAGTKERSFVCEQPQERVILEKAKHSVDTVGLKGSKNGTKRKQSIVNEAIKAMIQMRSDKRPIETKIFTENTTKSEAFYCELCPHMSFKTKRGVSNHMNIHVQKDMPKKMQRCEICGKIPRYSYERHMEIMHSNLRFKCDICAAEFKHKTTQKVHMLSHKGEKSFLCSICGKVFVSISKLSTHVSGVHRELEKKFACTYCDSKFKYRQLLSDHISSIHIKARPHVCEICDKTFATKRNLRMHKDIHDVAKLKCRYCEAVFKLRPSRWRHEMVFHRKVVMVGDKYMNVYKKEHREKLKMLNIMEHVQQ